MHAAPVNTSFVSVSKGDLGLIGEECVAFLKRKSVLLLNSRTGSTALRACFASGISDIGSEREDVLCAELETSAGLLEADDMRGAGLEPVVQLGRAVKD